MNSPADSNRGPSDATSDQVVGARDSDSTTPATGERRRAANDKRNSTESTSSSPVRADRASGRASGKQCVAASRNLLPLQVNGVLQPEPSATALTLRLPAFCIRRARTARASAGLQRVRRTGSCGKPRGVRLNSVEGKPGRRVVPRGYRVFFEIFDWPFGVSCSKSLGQLRGFMNVVCAVPMIRALYV